MHTSRALQDADRGTPLEVVAPVLFNTFKHHAGALRQRSRELADAGPAALTEFAARLAVLGTRLMDLYTGAHSPHNISSWLVGLLHQQGRLELDAFRGWLADQGTFAVVEHGGDGSRWVLRLGDEAGRYVHLHPGRRSPHTVRVRANVLKTAFLAVTHAQLHGGDPMGLATLNAVRREHLGLSPLGQCPEDDAGLGVIVGVLREGG